MSILRHWELALVPFCYLLWQHHHRQRHLGKKNKTKKTSGREKEDRWEERMICLSGQQTAACQIPITISFPPGGQFKAFPFRFRFLFFSFFFFWFRFTTQLPHQGRLAQECILTLFPGVLAEHHAHWRVEEHFTLRSVRTLQSSHAHRLWKKAVSLFPICHNIDWSLFFFVLLHVLRAIYEEYPCHRLRKYVQI